MKLAIATIQRNRNPWIVEWLAFHMLAGFNQFYVYCHKCDDGMEETLRRLAPHLPGVSLNVYAIKSDNKPQLAAYQHAWNTHGGQVDWMAFIDGDEFLFPVRHASMAEALAPYASQRLSALGVYWICYGSNGHIEEPPGLLLENYPRHSGHDFQPNRHIKMIVRGGQQPVICRGSHLFTTPLGAVDELLRPMVSPMMIEPGWEPSYETFRINHYVTQSRAYFKHIKQGIGAADRDPNLIRPDAWFDAHDRNDHDDGVARRFLPALKEKVRELQQWL